MMEPSSGEKNLMTHLAVVTQNWNVTNGQTDRNAITILQFV